MDEQIVSWKKIEHGYYLYCEKCGYQHYADLDPSLETQDGKTVTKFLYRYASHMHASVPMVGITNRIDIDVSRNLYQCSSCGNIEILDCVYFHTGNGGLSVPMSCSNCKSITGKIKSLSVLRCPVCSYSLQHKKIGKGKPVNYKHIRTTINWDE